MTDLAPSHMILVRQLMSKNGYMDLAELASALNKSPGDGDNFSIK
jgi:hypothetical protein